MVSLWGGGRPCRSARKIVPVPSLRARHGSEPTPNGAGGGFPRSVKEAPPSVERAQPMMPGDGSTSEPESLKATTTLPPSPRTRVVSLWVSRKVRSAVGSFTSTLANDSRLRASRGSTSRRAFAGRRPGRLRAEGERQPFSVALSHMVHLLSRAGLRGNEHRTRRRADRAPGRCRASARRVGREQRGGFLFLFVFGYFAGPSFEGGPSISASASRRKAFA